MEKIKKIFDDLKIKCEITKKEDGTASALVEFWTDTAGQDIPIEFDFDGTPEDFVEQFTERAEAYDVDDEVEIYINMRGKNGVPSSVRVLFDDCQEAKDTLMDISRRLNDSLNLKKVYRKRVEIEKNELERWNFLLNYYLYDMTDEEIEKYHAKPNDFEGGFLVSFDDGSEITIDLCSGTENYYDNIVWRKGLKEFTFDCRFCIGYGSQKFVLNDKTTYIIEWILKE